MRVWPNLFIAGAPRCGTSSLHAWLNGIPGIRMSRIKEPNYFSRRVIADDHPLVKPIRDEDEYLQLWSGAGEARYLGEASPNYLEDPDAPELIARRVPDARIVVSLRDPVERYHSTYLMFRNNLTSIGSLVREIRKGIEFQDNPSVPVITPRTGLYAAQVERYRAVFGDAQFKVLIFEEMMADIPAALGEILGFLGIKHPIAAFSEPAQRQYSEARGPLVRFLFGNRFISRTAESLIPYALRKRIRNAFLVREAPKPALDPEAREFLADYYRDDVARLERVLGRRLPWINFGGGATPSGAG